MPNKPEPPMNSKLRKALERHANWAHRWGKKNPSTYIYGESSPLLLDTVEAEKAIRQAVAEEILEIIDSPSATLVGSDGAWIKQAELRQKITEWSQS